LIDLAFLPLLLLCFVCVCVAVIMILDHCHDVPISSQQQRWWGVGCGLCPGGQSPGYCSLLVFWCVFKETAPKRALAFAWRFGDVEFSKRRGSGILAVGSQESQQITRNHANHAQGSFKSHEFPCKSHESLA
jgi:hypothetical protein